MMGAQRRCAPALPIALRSPGETTQAQAQIHGDTAQIHRAVNIGLESQETSLFAAMRLDDRIRGTPNQATPRDLAAAQRLAVSGTVIADGREYRLGWPEGTYTIPIRARSNRAHEASIRRAVRNRGGGEAAVAIALRRYRADRLAAEQFPRTEATVVVGRFGEWMEVLPQRASGDTTGEETASSAETA